MADNTSGAGGVRTIELLLFWAFVGVPLLWGVWGTITNAAKLFQ